VSEDIGQTTIPLILGVLFLIGLAADLIGRFTFLPRITLLLLSGLAIGPAGFSLLPVDFVLEWFPALTSIALALIGFLLGQQLSVSALKIRGTVVVGISLCKVVGAWLAVGLAFFLVGADPVVALLLAGIAPATAPAAIYDLVHESGARGEFTETLLSVVALDDVWGLLIFVVMMAFSGVLNGDTAISSGIAASLIDIGGSVALGVALGAPMAYLTGRVLPGEPTLAEALGFVLLGAGIAEWFNLLPILTAIVMGVMVASLATHHDRPFHVIEGIEWPFMILFFVLAGASFQVDALPLVGGLTTIYILSRCFGIYAGTRLGGNVVGARPPIRKWLGIALFPQAGVAIGMALLAAQRFPEIASIVLTVVVTSTIILETVGPIFTRQAIRAANAG
jgi:Kef-type K+ transport system membrane component KefB